MCLSQCVGVGVVRIIIFHWFSKTSLSAPVRDVNNDRSFSMDTVDKHVSDCETDNTPSTLADGPALIDVTTFCSAGGRDMSEPEKVGQRGVEGGA